MSSADPISRIVILDAGAQYGKVIDRRVRELCIESILLPLETPANELSSYSAIILSGGPQSVYGPAAPKYDPEIFNLGKPILGICYGLQLMNLVNGGTVVKKTTREDGQFTINVEQSSELYQTLPKSINVLLTHGDSIDTVAPGFIVTGQSPSGLISSIENPSKRQFGVQFHPEVDLTPDGQTIFSNFLMKICGLKPNFTLHSRLESEVELIRRTVGNQKVLCLLSGGVDSSVCAALLKHAIGPENIYAIHIDNGFMRLNESEKVEKALETIGLNLRVVDGKQKFYDATTTIDGQETEQLKVTVRPEVKRKIIGDTFMRVSEDEIRKLGLRADEVLLAQGTLRPDLIESGSHLASSNADVIKTHHNDTQLVRQLRAQGRIVEPLKDYHKDEVRALGTELGLPTELVWRQPFPGPGLAIRILCADEPYLTAADPEIVNSLSKFNSSTVNSSLLPCRTVGVQGDQRSYSSLVALSSKAGSKPDWPALFEIAKRIPKEVHGVNRVVYAFGSELTSSHYRTITPTRLLPDVIHQLQEADEIVNETLLQFNLIKSLSQVPVILLPVDFSTAGSRSISIRTFMTNDFMTGVPAIPGSKFLPEEALNQMVEKILANVKGITRVCFDLTAKPPATTEYE